MVTRWIKCACGVTFLARGNNVKRCPECRKRFAKIYARHYRRKGDGKAAKELALSELGENLPEEKKPGPRPLTAKTCPYCGTVFRTKNAYCNRCVMYGLDQLHQYKGKTNGWDRKGGAK